MCQNLLVPALDAGPQKDRPYQSDFYRAGSNAIPRGAREQDSFDTPPFYFNRLSMSLGFWLFGQISAMLMVSFSI
jgi:hypothetical protein